MKQKRILVALTMCLLIVGLCIPVYASAQGRFRCDDADIYMYGGVDFGKGFLMRDLVTYYGGMYGDDMEQLAQNIPGVNPVTGRITVGTNQKGYGAAKIHNLYYEDYGRKHIINSTSVKCGYKGSEAVMTMDFYSGTVSSGSLTIRSN